MARKKLGCTLRLFDLPGGTIAIEIEYRSGRLGTAAKLGASLLAVACAQFDEDPVPVTSAEVIVHINGVKHRSPLRDF